MPLDIRMMESPSKSDSSTGALAPLARRYDLGRPALAVEPEMS